MVSFVAAPDGEKLSVSSLRSRKNFICVSIFFEPRRYKNKTTLIEFEVYLVLSIIIIIINNNNNIIVITYEPVHISISYID